MFELIDNGPRRSAAVIKVVGVGGGGGNALEYMVKHHIEGVEFISINTDAQALENSQADLTVQIGANATGGLGAGCNPEIGQKAATEDRERIAEALQGADMVFIAAGMGGGTGTGAAPIIAEIARENGSLSIAVVTKPFEAEGHTRMETALNGTRQIESQVDSLIVVPNQKLITVLGKVSMLDAFAQANQVLHSAVQGIAELITRKGLINLDFADVKTVMQETGKAMIGTGSASDDNRAYEAAQAAISNPLLDDIDLSNVSGLLVSITAGPDFGLEEYNQVANCMQEIASEKSRMVIGVVIDENISDKVRVTLVATGLDNLAAEQALPSGQKAAWSAPDQEPPAEEAAVQDEEINEPDEHAKELAVPNSAARAAAANTGLDAPPFFRYQNGKNPTRSQDDLPEIHGDDEYLDIPAFLRQQVD